VWQHHQINPHGEQDKLVDFAKVFKVEQKEIDIVNSTNTQPKTK